MQADGEYELIYKDVTLGRHWVTIVATDNLGRFLNIQTPEFFVNGPARVEITSPKAGSKLNKSDGEITIVIHATTTGPALKNVSLEMWNSDATPVGNDDYVFKMKSCMRKCRLQAIAIDEQNVETHSEPVEFIVMDPPKPHVSWFDGEYTQGFEPGQTFKVSKLILVYSAESEHMFGAQVTKLELLANGVPLCTNNEPTFGDGGGCEWTPAPGKYKLQVIATDEDGAVGKSEPIEITIDRP